MRAKGPRPNKTPEKVRIRLILFILFTLLLIILLVIVNVRGAGNYTREIIGYSFSLLDMPDDYSQLARGKVVKIQTVFSVFDVAAQKASLGGDADWLKSLLFVKYYSSAAPKESEIHDFVDAAVAGNLDAVVTQKNKDRACEVYAILNDLLYSAEPNLTHATIQQAIEDLNDKPAGDRPVSFIPPVVVDGGWRTAVSSYYGPRTDPVMGGGDLQEHSGIDIALPKGTPILASAGGVVILARESNEGYGNVVALYHGDGLCTLYAHCSGLLVETGEQVTAAQQIALVGSTGNSTGPHVHFEILENGQPVNPRKYIS